MTKIGIFDSGCGGLSIVNALTAEPHQYDIVYYADTGFFPWGTKSKAALTDRLSVISDFFDKQGVDVIIPACHTISGLFSHELATMFKQPLHLIFTSTLSQYAPGEYTILVTKNSYESNFFPSLFSPPTHTIQQIVCHDLANHIESNQIDQALASIQTLLTDANYTKIILGCTHYSLIADRIQSQHPNLTIINPITYFVEAAGKHFASTTSNFVMHSSTQNGNPPDSQFHHFLNN